MLASQSGAFRYEVSREWGTKQGEVSLLMVSATSSRFKVLPVDRKGVCGGGDN